jgi:phosphoglycolate phosphatase-like HAD superfamily hydrolase
MKSCASRGNATARNFYPQRVRFPAFRLCSRPKENDCRIALATTCDPGELRHYKSILQIDGLIDAVACGEDVKRGKPEPDLHLIALRRLDAIAREALSLGDTPYDAIAARAARIPSIVGTLSGGFSDAELRAAGCAVVLAQAADLSARITAAAV